jgi:hypothetical protein
VYSVFFIVMWHCYYSVWLFFFCVLYCSFFLYCTVSAYDLRAATLIEFFFSCFFLSWKANAARTSRISYFFDCYVCLISWLLHMFRSLYSVYCLCVNVHCTTATTYQPNIYIYIYIYTSIIITAFTSACHLSPSWTKRFLCEHFITRYVFTVST